MSDTSYVCRKCSIVYSAEEYQSNKFCPECGTFLQRYLRPRGTKYWLFQANPDTYRIFDWWKDHPKDDSIIWSIRQYAKEVRRGDFGCIWLSGPKAGVYALIEIVSDPKTIERTDSEKSYWVDKKELLKSSKRSNLKYINKLFNSPIYREYCRQDSVLSDMVIFKQAQGTVFKLSKIQWDRIIEIIKRR